MQETVENKENWLLIIKSEKTWFDLNLTDLWHYRDLLIMFVRRDFVSTYKQTILGPLWFIIQPVLTTFLFVIIFDKVARIPTDQIPSPLFYLSGLVIWNYFLTCLNQTATTLSKNTDLFGKVYFPRLIVPLASVMSALISFSIQFVLLLLVLIYYILFEGLTLNINYTIAFIPVLLCVVAALGLGIGIIVSAVTTKYRDLLHLVTFGTQLLLYVTPVIYPLSFVTEQYRAFLLANPVTPLIESFRYALLGEGTLGMGYLAYSIGITTVILMIGILVFNKVQKNFMDVI
jgi:lipopolysaccharide transport system permease protein